MALTLAQYRTFSNSLEVTQKDARGACHFGSSAAPVSMSIATRDMCHRKGGFLHLPDEETARP
jgi:hypothetical protein